MLINDMNYYFSLLNRMKRKKKKDWYATVQPGLSLTTPTDAASMRIRIQGVVCCTLACRV